MPTLKRLPHWEELLGLYIERCRDERFEWGLYDCATFASGAVKAITGKDIAADFIGKYDDERSAAEFLRERKWKTLKQAASRKLGKAVHPAHATEGDIVLKSGGTLADKALGVCVGQYSWFVGEEPHYIREDGQMVFRTGLVMWPTLQCTAAWKVG